MNLPKDEICVKLNNETLQFVWHTRRAVALSVGKIACHRTRPHHAIKKKERDEILKTDPSQYAVFYLYSYFDPIASKDKDKDSSCLISFYSRQCGRFIKEIDAATFTGCNKSGSSFSQGVRFVSSFVS